MLKIVIKDIQAMEELKQLYAIKPYASLLFVLRKVIKKLIPEDDTLEFVMPESFLSETYRKNPHSFCVYLRRGLGLKVLASRNANLQTVTFRVGFEIETFGFAKNLTRELMKSTVFSVDVPIDEIPISYRQQPFHFLHRLTKRIGKKISLIKLGEDWRFVKPKPTTKQKQ